MLRKLILAALAMLVLPMSSALADVRIGVGIGVPVFRPFHRHHYYRPYLGVYVGPPPVYVAPPPPVYVQPVPAPVYVQPMPGQPLVPPPPVSPLPPR